MKKSMFLLLGLISLLLAACQQRGQYYAQLSHIDSLADTRPERADSLLQTLAPAMPSASKADSMHYALMRLKTDDKLYRPITDRQPLALRLVDYYKHHHHKGSLLPTALFYAGRVCADLGDAPQALDYYQKALSSFQNEENLRMAGLLQEQIGYIFYYQGFFSQALEHFEKSYQCRKLENDTIGSIYNLRDIANSHLQMQEMDSCESSLLSALSLVENSCNRELHADILSQLARLYNKKQMYAQAHDIVMPLLEGCTDSMNLGAYYSIAATAYSHIGRTDSARLLCLKLMDVGNKYGQQFASRFLAEYAFSNHNESEALHYTRIYEQLTDSIHKADNAKAVIQINSMYNYQLHQTEFARLRIDNERKQKIVYMAIAVFLVMVMLMGVFVFYSRYKQAKFQMWVERLQNQNLQNEQAIQNYKIQIEEDINSIKQLDESEKVLKEELRKLQQDKVTLFNSTQQREAQFTQQIKEIDEERALLKRQLSDMKIRLDDAEKNVKDEHERVVLLNTAVRKTEIFKKIQSKLLNRNYGNSIRMTQMDWKELERTVNDIFHDIMKKMSEHVSFNETEWRISLLILLELPHKDIAELVCISPSAESTARRRLYSKVTNKIGAAHDWDAFLKKIAEYVTKN